MRYQNLKQLLTAMGLNHSYRFSMLPFWMIRPMIRSYYGNVWNELPVEIKALFIHIPKCAGTSVTSVLYGKEMGHRPAVLYRATNPRRFHSIPSFAIIRNPYDRFCSIFNHNKCPRFDSEKDIFDKKFYSGFSNSCEFAHALGRDGGLTNAFMSHILARPQVEWIKIENKIAVNYLFCYEKLQKLQNFLNDLSGDQSMQLPYANASGRSRSWDAELDEGAKEIVYNLYKEDFRLWETLQSGMIEIDSRSQRSGPLEQREHP